MKGWACYLVMTVLLPVYVLSSAVPLRYSHVVHPSLLLTKMGANTLVREREDALEQPAHIFHRQPNSFKGEILSYFYHIITYNLYYHRIHDHFILFPYRLIVIWYGYSIPYDGINTQGFIKFVLSLYRRVRPVSILC